MRRGGVAVTQVAPGLWMRVRWTEQGGSPVPGTRLARSRKPSGVRVPPHTARFNEGDGFNEWPRLLDGFEASSYTRGLGHEIVEILDDSLPPFTMSFVQRCGIPTVTDIQWMAMRDEILDRG